ncbi:MAG: molybdopterin-guanine dinucleotide biosynthesis protein B [Deltaproteobacteria bacterium]|nr:molybdopterin-guanine dinucleotide biosynthesis protein B [Deltaproteobacteria bacterium]
MNNPDALPPIVCFIGRSNSGKTTLIEKLLPALNRLGIKAGTIKHDVHGFDIDKPGKDSWRHKEAGAKRTVISSPAKLALVQDTDHDFTLDELAGFFKGLDLILAEGYKREQKPKIEIFRPEADERPLFDGNGTLIALVSDTETGLDVPVFGLEDIDGLAEFIRKHFHL